MHWNGGSVGRHELLIPLLSAVTERIKINPFCTCILEVESTTHVFLHCHHFNAIGTTLNNSLKAIDKDIVKFSGSFLTKVILYGNFKYSDIQNNDIVNSIITYILDSKRFDCSLMYCKAPLSVYSKIHFRNVWTLLSLFNMMIFPKLHCGN